MAKTVAERKRDYMARAKDRGEVPIGFPIPGELHLQLIADADELGISLKELIIRKLYRGAGNEDV